MRTAIICTGFIVLGLLICGCTTTSQETATPVQETPNLVGNWSGPMYGYIEGVGYTTFSDETLTMNVIEQHNRVFSGVLTFSNRVVSWEDKTFAGVIDNNDRTFTLVEQGGGFASGTLITPDEIELTYLEIGQPYNIALDALKRR